MTEYLGPQKFVALMETFAELAHHTELLGVMQSDPEERAVRLYIDEGWYVLVVMRERSLWVDAYGWPAFGWIGTAHEYLNGELVHEYAAYENNSEDYPEPF